jgi:hypothetical protein
MTAGNWCWKTLSGASVLNVQQRVQEAYCLDLFRSLKVNPGVFFWFWGLNSGLLICYADVLPH